MPDRRPIGVFDSGIGGLTVVRELVRLLPRESLVYFGDTARVPYGPKSPETVQRYSREAAAFLLTRDVKAIVIACNTATAHAGSLLAESLPCLSSASSSPAHGPPSRPHAPAASASSAPPAPSDPAPTTSPCVAGSRTPASTPSRARSSFPSSRRGWPVTRPPASWRRTTSRR
jgi:hypothetical protein